MTTEGSVYRRKDGRWVAQYRDARGKVRYVYRKTRGEAKKALREALQDRDEGYVPAQKPFSSLSEGLRGIFTVSTESSEITCLLHLKIPNVVLTEAYPWV